MSTILDTPYQFLQAATAAAKEGDLAKAGDYLEQALQLQPAGALRFQLARQLMDIGQLEKAAACAQEGIAKKPKDFSLVNLYGVILKRLCRYEEAIEWFKKAAKLDSTSASPAVNLGNTYLILDQPQQAAEYFLKATKLQPKEGENHRLLARAYSAMGQQEKALSALNIALLRSPKNIRIRRDICRLHYLKRDYERALKEAEKSLGQFPDDSELLRAKAATLRKQGNVTEAIAIHHRILAADPQEAQSWVHLGNIYYYDFADREQANAHYAKALAIDPDNIEAASQYCDCLLNSRYGNEAEHIEKAYEVAKMLLEKVPNPITIAEGVQNVFLRNADYERLRRLGERRKLFQYWVNHMNVGELHSQLGRVESMEDRLELLSCHRQWGEKIEAIARRQPLLPAPAIRTRNKIRIGLLSSDLRNHPVTYFVQPLLEHYDRSQFEFYCYSFYPGEPDSVQKQLTTITDKFTVYPALSDHEAAQRIANDELDILFELGGTTYQNRVELLAYRPAPVQVSWLGYPHSCGLADIDYILVDPYIQPEQPELLIEKPFTLPETWVSLGKLGFHDIPIDPQIPEECRGYITFGTANNPYKYTPKVLETWAKILREVPDSRFLFIRPEGAVRYFRENVCRLFAEQGVAAHRIEFTPVRGQHMPHYNLLDIALDPFPHTGGTTTCETLWMGVPVITLVGQAFFERLSYSNLNNAGLGDLCTFTIEEYIQKAVALARDKARRGQLRRTLRQQIAMYPLGQNERFVRNFEAKVKEVI